MLAHLRVSVQIILSDSKETVYSAGKVISSELFKNIVNHASWPVLSLPFLLVVLCIVCVMWINRGGQTL